MYKRGIAMLLVLVLALGALPLGAAAEAEAPALAWVGTTLDCANSDLEATAGNVTWYVDNLGSGRILTARLPGSGAAGQEHDLSPEIAPLTDWAAEQLLLWQGKLYASVGAELRCLDPETGAILETEGFSGPLARFAFGPRGRYALVEGRVLGPEGEALTPAGVRSFWLEEGDRLCWMRDETHIHSLRLSDGRETLEANLSTDLGDVPLFAPAKLKRGAGVTTLRQKFPAGKYWNHMPNLGTGPRFNNQDGWTNIPCPKHNNYCGTALQSCNGFDPDGKGELTWQCYGYAEKCGFDATGRSPEDGMGWKTLWYSAALDSLKAGDIIRYKRNGLDHSIYVTAVSGDTIRFTDCNYDGTCVIRWDQTVAKSTVKASFLWLHSAPSALTQEPSFTLELRFLCNGAEREDCAGFGSFALWLDGAPYRTACTAFRETLLAGTQYEIKNLQGVHSGVTVGVAQGELSGTLEEDRSLVLTFDGVVEEREEEPVVPPFTDMPSPKSWAYAPICWAVRKGITGGMTETSFAPDRVCTRAQTVTFLWRAAGKPTPTRTEHPFTDVSDRGFYAKALLWALETGITKGKTETAFWPEGSCTRGEIVTFLWRLAGKPRPQGNELPFADVKAGSYCERAVRWAVEQGVAKGMDGTHFAPDEPCTRAQVVAFLYRWYG